MKILFKLKTQKVVEIINRCFGQSCYLVFKLVVPFRFLLLVFSMKLCFILFLECIYIYVRFFLGRNINKLICFKYHKNNILNLYKF